MRTPVAPFRASASVSTWLSVLLCLLAGAHALWVTLPFGGESRLLIADLMYFVVVLAAFALTLVTWQGAKQHRRALQTFVIAMGAQCIGDAWMLYLDFAPQLDTAFSIGDLCYLVYYAGLMATLLQLQRIRLTSVQALIWLAGSLVTVGVLAEFIWINWLGEILRDTTSEDSILNKVVIGGYIFLDLLVLVFGLLLLRWNQLRRAALLLPLGLVVFMLADLWYFHLIYADHYQAGHLLDTLWPLGLALQVLGLSALTQQAPPSKKAAPNVVWLDVLPYLAVAVAVVVLLTQPNHITPNTVAIRWFTALIFALVMVLQGLTFWQNRRLQQHLRQQAKELRAHQTELAQLAFTDQLTGLPNRAAFYRNLNELLVSDPVLTQVQQVSLLFVDLDGFKQVNDSRGHDGGDQLLREVAGRFNSVVKSPSTVFRIGGDEFTILVPAGPDEALLTAQRALKALTQPFEIHDQPTILSASIGIASTGAQVDSAETLLTYADNAMYTAKSRGKNQIYVHQAAPELVGAK